MNETQLPLATAWKSFPGIKAAVLPRIRATCLHCGFEPSAVADGEPFYDEHRTSRRATVLRGVAARQGESNACSSRLIVEQAAQRFFELAQNAAQELSGRFTEREWDILLSGEPSPAWNWHRLTTVATMVADDLGIESLDELHPDSELHALLVKLGDLTPLENATLVDACERVWRGLENPLR
jgi:hypothetical protein